MIMARRETLNDCLAHSAVRPAVPVWFIESTGQVVETSWQEIDANARRCAAALMADGIRPGDRVAVLGATSRRLVESILGIFLAGGTVVMLPLPLRMSHLDLFLAGTLNMVETARARLIITDALHAPFFPAPAPGVPRFVLAEELGQSAPLPSLAELPRVSSSDIAVLQFTSGSTRRPKGVCLTHAAICSNYWASQDALRLSAADRWVTWLPLYHDMGLIGGLFVPMIGAASTTMMPAQTFVMEPQLWMRTISQRKATAIVAPNFAYALSAKVLNKSEGLDLSSVRVALCGAEPIVVKDIAAFLDAGRRFGLKPDVMVPCYGLAEGSLAVSMTPLAREMVVDHVDERRLEPEGRAIPVAPADTKKTVVSVGRPLRGVSVQIVDGAGRGVDERVVGEVRIASCSLMLGYEGSDADQVGVENGWFATGDLGYVADGELFICGRKKDLLKINGRNIWPDDVEHIVQGVPGARKGNACVFGLTDERGHEVIIVVAEASKDIGDCAALPGDILTAVGAQIGIPPRHVVVVEPGSLPKTTSGKLARGRTRELYRQRALRIKGEAGLGVGA